MALPVAPSAAVPAVRCRRAKVRRAARRAEAAGRASGRASPQRPGARWRARPEYARRGRWQTCAPRCRAVARASTSARRTGGRTRRTAVRRGERRVRRPTSFPDRGVRGGLRDPVIAVHRSMPSSSRRSSARNARVGGETVGERFTVRRLMARVSGSGRLRKAPVGSAEAHSGTTLRAPRRGDAGTSSSACALTIGLPPQRG